MCLMNDLTQCLLYDALILRCGKEVAIMYNRSAALLMELWTGGGPKLTRSPHPTQHINNCRSRLNHTNPPI